MESSAGNYLESRNLPVTELDSLTKDVWIAKGGTVSDLCFAVGGHGCLLFIYTFFS